MEVSFIPEFVTCSCVVLVLQEDLSWCIIVEDDVMLTADFIAKAMGLLDGVNQMAALAFVKLCIPTRCAC